MRSKFSILATACFVLLLCVTADAQRPRKAAKKQDQQYTGESYAGAQNKKQGRLSDSVNAKQPVKKGQAKTRKK